MTMQLKLQTWIKIVTILTVAFLSGFKAIEDSSYISYHDGKLGITNDGQQLLLVILHNQSTQQIILDNADRKPAASAGWSSKLNPKSASAFLLNKKTFSFSCQDSDYQYIECDRHIKAHVIPQDNISKENMGTYWVEENQSENILQKNLREQHFQYE